ncbi:hypothetical protein PITCH_A2050026 [uncultured Desulfobacterium sp.]|uniref:DUF1329 domain-containing protein n=1 Tax=uncultured Desulfobacterium sp. TaxID=201089 RepID=A0A445MXD6_9BACT|nr:hypothetical protein PITCH_A2050026 [uncultured Desulfobacterium sp.]
MKHLKLNWISVSGAFLLYVCLGLPYLVNGAEIPSPEEVISKQLVPPTIEDLTGGKVKDGDVIEKNNMDIVREYLPAGAIECINQGMKLIMRCAAEKPFENVIKVTREMTIANAGKAVMDTTGAVYYEQIGTFWPGGLPYLSPKDGMEVMANVKYGISWDDYHTKGTIYLVNKEGQVYKKISQENKQIMCCMRKSLPPLGVWPGYEGQMFRRLSVITYPLELRGQGQFVVRYYDDAKNYDTGFNYFPTFKRTLRISTTVWQDNLGGSDNTNGDSEGLKEPYSDWNFKLVGAKYILIPEHRAPFIYYSQEEEFNPKLQWDEGRRWPRMGWTILPMYVVEATPKQKHVYSKKVMYVASPTFPQPISMIEMFDAYDPQGKLWKFYCPHNGSWQGWNEKWGITTPWGTFMADLQTRHTTQFWFNININQGFPPTLASFKELVAQGR